MGEDYIPDLADTVEPPVEEMEEIGYEDCFYGEGVCLIEWSRLIEDILPENIIRVEIEKEPKRGFDYRRITVKGL